MTLDPNDARALALSGHVRAFLGRAAEQGIALHQRALLLNPSLPIAWAFLGLANCYVGRHDDAVRQIGEARRLSPFDPHGFFFEMALMVSHMLKRDHETALRVGLRAIELNAGFSSSYKGVLSILGHLGRKTEAAEILKRLLQLEPKFTLAQAISRSPILQPDDLAYYAEGLRLGGLT